MDIDVLKSELVDDPLGIGYAGMSDAEATYSLNEVNRPVSIPIPMSAVVRWAARCDAINSLEQATESGDKDLRRLAKAALVMVNHPHIDSFDIGDPELAGMVNVLVAANILEQAAVDDLAAMATSHISRAEEIGLRRITIGYAREARR